MVQLLIQINFFQNHHFKKIKIVLNFLYNKKNFNIDKKFLTTTKIYFFGS